jgi:hypothetical protein
MEEFLENLLYSATFPEMDTWRRFSAAPQPPDAVMRVFVRMELRLQQRYGVIELERLVAKLAMKRFVRETPVAAIVVGGIALYSVFFDGKYRLASACN